MESIGNDLGDTRGRLKLWEGARALSTNMDIGFNIAVASDCSGNACIAISMIYRVAACARTYIILVAGANNSAKALKDGSGYIDNTGHER